MEKLLQRFKSCEAGATAIEYSLIAAFIGLGIVTAASGLGTELSRIFALFIPILAAV